MDSNNYIHIAYLLLLANYGKVTSADMVKFNLTDEPYQLMPKLDKAVEPDYRFMIMSSPEENYYFRSYAMHRFGCWVTCLKFL